jgi:hypothetical protein
MKTSKIILGLFIVQIVCLMTPQMVFCQTEALEGVQYTPPKGWVKTEKQGAVTYTDVNKATNAFCILTVYGERPGAGDPQRDFATKWNELVVTPFKAESNPKTDLQTTADGWQAVSGGAQIDMQGVKALAVLTVVSGYGKVAGVLAITNDESYLAKIQAVLDGIKLDKASAPAKASAPSSTDTSDELADPFPDQPGYSPQKPLLGKLKKTITMADLVGKWDDGAGSVQRYVDSATGDYAGTNTSFFGEGYSIRSDGTFDYLFVGRSSNHTVRESDSGTITLSGGYITVRFKGRMTHKYQFIAFMAGANGAAVLSLVEVHDTFQGYDPEGMRRECGHPGGFISCVGGEEWARVGAKL